MTKYRKKPVVIEATQWFKLGDHPEVVWNAGPMAFWIETLEGGHTVTPGDWIITGVKGEHYPCKPDIFEMTYELAQPEQQDETSYAGVHMWVGNRYAMERLSKLKFIRSTIEPRRLLELVAERCIKELTHD